MIEPGFLLCYPFSTPQQAMTENVFDANSAGVWLLIGAAALAIVFLYVLVVLAISLFWKLGQQFLWWRWSKKINRFFNELVRENNGYLTALDLSMKANLTAEAAKRFLAKKAEEFPNRECTLDDGNKGYYFLTAGSIAHLFDQNEASNDLEAEEEWDEHEEDNLDSPAPFEVGSTLDVATPSEPSTSTTHAAAIADSVSVSAVETPSEESPSSELENNSSDATVASQEEFPSTPLPEAIDNQTREPLEAISSPPEMENHASVPLAPTASAPELDNHTSVSFARTPKEGLTASAIDAIASTPLEDEVEDPIADVDPVVADEATPTQQVEPEPATEAKKEATRKRSDLFQFLARANPSEESEIITPGAAPELESDRARALIQAELARRLDVHSSTVAKRRTEPDFAQWSQNRDPDGIAWQYSEKDKVFVPIESG